MKKILKRLLIVLIVVCILIVGAYFAVGNYFYNYALRVQDDAQVFNDTKSTELSDEAAKASQKMYENSLDWFENESNYTDAYIQSDDDLKLHGYVVDQESDTWVIAVHGYQSNAKSMVISTEHFYESGYNVLLPDLRGHGDSEGDYVGMGWPDRKDILNWIDYVLEENPDANIILYGVSMGAATVMMTSGEKMPDNVKMIIEDCGYTSVWDEFEFQLRELFNLPDFPALYAANTVTKIRASYDFGDASAINQVKKCEVPMLFIHGDKDDFVPFSMLDELYDSATCEKEKLVIHGATHAKACVTDPELYWSTVDNFIKKYSDID